MTSLREVARRLVLEPDDALSPESVARHGRETTGHPSLDCDDLEAAGLWMQTLRDAALVVLESGGSPALKDLLDPVCREAWRGAWAEYRAPKELRTQASENRNRSALEAVRGG